jgi:hypothetical protein
VPSLDLRFADNKSLVDAVTGASLVTFTRASSGTFANSAGTLQTAVTNLLLRSEEFDGSPWTKNNSCTITNDATASPAGTLTADQFNGAAISFTGVFTFPTTASGAVYTFSIYIKNNLNATSLRLGVESNPTNAFVTFNAATGTITSVAANVTSSSVQFVGNGWYRVVLTYTATGTSAGLIIYSTSGAVATWFAWGAQLEQAATVGEYIPTTSAINSAPRFDHNPTTGESLGLLVEEARTNLVLRSEEFDNASWAKVGSTVTANTGTAPDGAATADLLTRTTTGVSYATQTFTKAASAIQYTFTVFAKQSVGNFCALRVQGTYPSRVDVVFNLSSATVSTAATVFGSFTGPSASITPYANGWYRLTVTGTSDAVVALQVLTSFNSNGTVADGTDSVSNSAGLLWGAQLEAGSGPPTSYIPTTTAATTRSASLADLISSAIANNIRSFYVEFSSPVVGTRGVVSLNDNTANERADLLTSGTDPRLVVHDGGAEQANINGGTVAAGVRTRVAVRISTNDFAISINGGAVVSDTSGTLPTVDRLMLGRTQAGEYLNGRIARFTGWAGLLPNPTLQSLSL